MKNTTKLLKFKVSEFEIEMLCTFFNDVNYFNKLKKHFLNNL